MIFFFQCGAISLQKCKSFCKNQCWKNTESFDVSNYFETKYRLKGDLTIGCICCINEAGLYANISKKESFKLSEIFIFCRFAEEKIESRKKQYLVHILQKNALLSQIREGFTNIIVWECSVMCTIHIRIQLNIIRWVVFVVIEIDHWVKL